MSEFTFPQVDVNDPTPKYLQTQRILADAIRDGHLPAGAKLPSTKQIGSLVNVSLITAHKALERLVDDGLLRREVGRGTYVCDDIQINGGPRMAIGLVIDQHVNIDDYYHSSILDGLRRASQADGQRVEFFFRDRYTSPRTMQGASAGMICLHPPLGRQVDVERLSQSVPLVVVGGAFPSDQITCLDCDNLTGARQATRFLLDAGHRRILILSGPTSLSNSRDRVEGAQGELRDAMVEHADDDLIISDDSVTLDEAACAKLAGRLLAPDRPTAVVACGFYLALAVMQSARAAQLSIPRDLSVVGFDDPAAAPMLDPPLTTVRQPLREMAALAYQTLRDTIGGTQADPAVLRLPTKLIVRDSTAPPCAP